MKLSDSIVIQLITQQFPYSYKISKIFQTSEIEIMSTKKQPAINRQ